MCEGELETEQNCNILTPTLMAITAFLSRSPGLLNRKPEDPASLGHVPHSSIFSPTYLKFLSLGLYNNLTPTLLPASVLISHSVQPLDSQGHILIFLDWCISYFDSLAGSEVNIQHYSKTSSLTHVRNALKLHCRYFICTYLTLPPRYWCIVCSIFFSKWSEVGWN